MSLMSRSKILRPSRHHRHVLTAPMVSYFISAYLVRHFKLNNAFLEKIKADLAKRELEKVAVNHQKLRISALLTIK